MCGIGAGHGVGDGSVRVGRTGRLASRPTAWLVRAGGSASNALSAPLGTAHSELRVAYGRRAARVKRQPARGAGGAGSTSAPGLRGIRLGEEAADRIGGGVGVEAMASEERVGSLATDTRIRNAGEGSSASCEEAVGRGRVGGR